MITIRPYIAHLKSDYEVELTLSVPRFFWDRLVAIPDLYILSTRGNRTVLRHSFYLDTDRCIMPQVDEQLALMRAVIARVKAFHYEQVAKEYDAKVQEYDTSDLF